MAGAGQRHMQGGCTRQTQARTAACAGGTRALVSPTLTVSPLAAAGDVNNLGVAGVGGVGVRIARLGLGHAWVLHCYRQLRTHTSAWRCTPPAAAKPT